MQTFQAVQNTQLPEKAVLLVLVLILQLLSLRICSKLLWQNVQAILLLIHPPPFLHENSFTCSRKSYYKEIKKTVFQYPNYERTKEYWAGWILSYYQWHSNLTFASIQKFLSIDTILSLYNPLHEAPEEKFIEAADSIIARNLYTKPTKLQLLRKAAGLTQKELSELSGINLRTLQQYEIRLKDINKASGDSINALAKALCCNFYDVMEI